MRRSFLAHRSRIDRLGGARSPRASVSPQNSVRQSKKMHRAI